jgi:hypothetical protein
MTPICHQHSQGLLGREIPTFSLLEVYGLGDRLSVRVRVLGGDSLLPSLLCLYSLSCLKQRMAQRVGSGSPASVFCLFLFRTTKVNLQHVIPRVPQGGGNVCEDEQWPL